MSAVRGGAGVKVRNRLSLADPQRTWTGLIHWSAANPSRKHSITHFQLARLHSRREWPPSTIARVDHMLVTGRPSDGTD